MPVYYLGKGAQFAVLDDLFDGTNEDVYRSALRDLGESSLSALTERRQAAGSRLTDTDVRHFGSHWLGAGEKAWWPNLDVERVFTAGLQKAIETALPKAKDKDGIDRRLLPIEALWVCANENVFHVYVNEGPHQVTMIVYTPPPGSYEATSNQFDENMWVVKIRDNFDGTLQGSPIIRLNPGEEWPIIITRQLQYTNETQA